MLQEQTNYHFDVKPDQLHGALDRFAQFFIAPLCKADALEREVQAVNNEFVGMHLTVLRSLSASLSSGVVQASFCKSEHDPRSTVSLPLHSDAMPS